MSLALPCNRIRRQMGTWKPRAAPDKYVRTMSSGTEQAEDEDMRTLESGQHTTSSLGLSDCLVPRPRPRPRQHGQHG
jgi:hypothetical protein